MTRSTDPITDLEDLMDTWYQRPMCGFDLETTGPDPTTARIVTACTVRVGKGLMECLDWLSDVDGQPIPDEAAAIHGITTEKAHADGLDLREVVDQLNTQIRRAAADGLPIVAMNARYDLTVLDREIRRFGMTPFTDLLGNSLLVVDPYVLDKQVDRYRKGKRTLTAACAHYGIQLEDAHNASADALAACRISWKIANRHRAIGSAPLADLHAQQVTWAAEQAAGLQAHFRKTDPDAVVEGRWPLVPHDDEEPAEVPGARSCCTTPAGDEDAEDDVPGF